MNKEYVRADTPPKNVEKKIVYKKQINWGERLYPWFAVIGFILFACLANGLVEFLVKL